MARQGKGSGRMCACSDPFRHTFPFPQTVADGNVCVGKERVTGQALVFDRCRSAPDPSSWPTFVSRMLCLGRGRNGCWLVIDSLVFLFFLGNRSPTASSFIHFLGVVHGRLPHLEEGNRHGSIFVRDDRSYAVFLFQVELLVTDLSIAV